MELSDEHLDLVKSSSSIRLEGEERDGIGEEDKTTKNINKILIWTQNLKKTFL